MTQDALSINSEAVITRNLMLEAVRQELMLCSHFEQQRFLEWLIMLEKFGLHRFFSEQSLVNVVARARGCLSSVHTNPSPQVNILGIASRFRFALRARYWLTDWDEMMHCHARETNDYLSEDRSYFTIDSNIAEESHTDANIALMLTESPYLSTLYYLVLNGMSKDVARVIQEEDPENAPVKK